LNIIRVLRGSEDGIECFGAVIDDRRILRGGWLVYQGKIIFYRPLDEFEMRSWFPAITLVLVVVLAGCAAPLQTSPSANAEGDRTTIDVSGTGEVSSDADLALVFVSVTAQAETANAARAGAARDSERMRSALRERGVPDNAVETVSFRIGPRYNGSGRDPQIIGYSAVHTYKIEVEPDRAGNVIDLAVGNGADEVDGVQFTLRDETKRALRDQALARAVNAARSDADTVASSTELSITGVSHVSTSGGFTPLFESVAFRDAGGGAATTLEPGPVTVEATVSITYTAE
jgi:uncharacterized protein YggE